MAIVFEEITGEIAPSPRGGEAAEPRAGSEPPPALDADALRHLQMQQQRLIARLSTD